MQPFDLLTYDDADIKKPCGEDGGVGAVDMKPSLWKRQLLPWRWGWGVRAVKPKNIDSFCQPGAPCGVAPRQPTNRHCLLGRDPCGNVGSSEEHPAYNSKREGTAGNKM